MAKNEQAQIRMMRRRRRTILLSALLLTSCIILFSLLGIDDTKPSAGDESETGQTPAIPSSEPTSTQPSITDSSVTVSPSESETSRKGDGTWDYAKPLDATATGDAGTLLRYNVAVEGGTEYSPEAFATFISETLADKRGWTAGNQWRFKQVKKGTADFTVYLATPETRRELCGDGDDYTSCRSGDAVVVNLERWEQGVPHWNDDLETYRHYVLNHEIGHRLGEGHVVCPRKGTPSPVMAQQTLSLGGCKPNAWPYVNGAYITGPFGEYG